APSALSAGSGGGVSRCGGIAGRTRALGSGGGGGVKALSGGGAAGGGGGMGATELLARTIGDGDNAAGFDGTARRGNSAKLGSALVNPRRVSTSVFCCCNHSYRSVADVVVSGRPSSFRPVASRRVNVE